MLILFGRSGDPVAVITDTTPRRRCEFFPHVEAYVARQTEPGVRETFERHLIECDSCQRAVHLGRISNRLNHHNISVGMPCAGPTRRKS